MNINDKGLQILTDTGWSDFKGVVNNGIHATIEIILENGKNVKCTPDHEFYTKGLIKVQAKDLTGHDVILDDGTTSLVVNIIDSGYQEVFDVLSVEKNNRFYANSVLASNCQFISFDSTLINPLVLQGLRSQEPMFRTGEVRWYSKIDPECTYFVALDPSLGVRGDFSAIQIIEMPTFKQVGEWLSDTAEPKKQVQVLYEILKYIDGEMFEDDEGPSIFWSFENNSIGEATITVIENTGLEYFPGVLISEKQTITMNKTGGKKKRHRKGLNTTTKSKLLACSKMKSLIDSGKFKPVSAGLISQLKNFVSVGIGYKAKPGTYDDLVMATALTMRVIEMSTSYDVFDPNILKETVDVENYSDPMFFSMG